MINICLILKVANVSINVINVFIIIYGGGGGICVFGLVDEKRQQNLTVITRKAYKGTLNQEIYIVSVSLDTLRNPKKAVSISMSGNFQLENRFLN